MNCARCGNALHRIPMFDLPRRVNEFSCLCCGERFWTTQGVESPARREPEPASSAEPWPPLLFHPNAHRN
jgi:hypothetical protein